MIASFPAPPLHPASPLPRVSTQLPDVPEGGQGTAFHRQAGADDHQVARQPPRQTAQVPAKIGAVGAQQEAVTDRVAVDLGVPVPSGLGAETAAVGRDGKRDVETAPAAQLQPPCELGVLAVGEEGVGEDLVVGIGDVGQGLAAKKNSGAGAAKDPRGASERIAVGLAGATVEVASGAGDEHPGGVDDRRNFELCAVGTQELWGHGADLGSLGTARHRFEETAHEIGPRRAVGVEE